MAAPQHDVTRDAPLEPEALVAELARVQEELRLSREELAHVREENERVLEEHARVRRGRRKAQKEAAVLAKALADALYRELRARAEGGRWGRRKSDDRISKQEWQQVLLLHRSDDFRATWYLRQNLAVARRGIEPALHFLRYGVVEARDPSPGFDVRDYLEEHPDVRASGENPVIHAMVSESPSRVGRRSRP